MRPRDAYSNIISITSPLHFSLNLARITMPSTPLNPVQAQGESQEQGSLATCSQGVNPPRTTQGHRTETARQAPTSPTPAIESPTT